MTRVGNWQGLLQAFLTEHQFDTFEYGRWDCCMFVCDAVRAMTGTDPARDIRGTYSTPMESRRVMRAYGARSMRGLVETVTARCGMPEVQVLSAHRGDAALVVTGRSCSLGLVGLNGREVVLTSAKGLWSVPLPMASRAWRV